VNSHKNKPIAAPRQYFISLSPFVLHFRSLNK